MKSNINAHWSLLIIAALFSTPGHAQVAQSPPAVPASVSSAAQGGTQAQPDDAIANFEIKQNADGLWIATCDIALNGQHAWRQLAIAATLDPEYAANDPDVVTMVPLDMKVGIQSHTIELKRPDFYSDFYNTRLSIVERTHKQVQTEWVIVRLNGITADGKPFKISKSIKQTIRWPDKYIWDADQSIRKNGPSKSLNNAVQLIDEGTQETLADARLLLERLLLKDGKMVAAYIEMARVSMKTNWGVEGLLQARRYLDSALSIEPNNVNALILRGYVSAHQGHYKDAETDFANASKSNPRNLWLWSNWGEVLAMQGKTDDAIKMYLKGVDHPPTNDTYDRAREDAYAKLIRLYEDRRDLDAIERMHQGRVHDFDGVGCYVIPYALFKLQERDDPDAAIDLLKNFHQLECGNNSSKEALGIAYYVKWSQSSEPLRTEFINRARIYFPIGAKLFYRLSSSPSTLKAAKALIKSGEHIDQKDNNGMTALAYALERRAYDIVDRLVKTGASPTASVGDQAMPIALIPVFSNDLEGVRLLRKLGVNYASINFQGMSATNYARKIGNKKMIDALGSASPNI